MVPRKIGSSLVRLVLALPQPRRPEALNRIAMATKDPGNTPYTRTVQYAAKTVGSAERLAAVLAVEHAQLLQWISGAAFPPHEVFLKALDIVRPTTVRRAWADTLEGCLQLSVAG